MLKKLSDREEWTLLVCCCLYMVCSIIRKVYNSKKAIQTLFTC